MNQTRLLFGLAAVLAGIATLEFVLAFVYTPALFAIAVPFGAAAYVMWYQASGRLRERAEGGRAREYRQPGAERGGFGAGPRESFSGRRGGFGAGRAREAGSGGARDARGGGGRRVRTDPAPSAAEAYRTLGLDPGADDEAVREAYRERVKEVHPDREGGDEEAFKRVKSAYERLRD